MANEITFTANLSIAKLTTDGTRMQLQYQNTPNAFRDDMTGAKGPSPGAIEVSKFGTDINLSQLDHPGWCVFKNLDEFNPVEIGVYNTDQAEFYPFIRLKPGKFCIVPLSPRVNLEYAGTGTGTTPEANTLRAVFENADGVLSVEAFEE